MPFSIYNASFDFCTVIHKSAQPGYSDSAVILIEHSLPGAWSHAWSLESCMQTGEDFLKMSGLNK